MAAVKGSIKVSVKGNVNPFLARLVKMWPALQYGFMSEMGYQGRRALKENYLEGQVITLTKDFDVAGRRIVSYSIAKNRKYVAVSAYPLNLFGPQAVYSSASSDVQARVETAMRQYDVRVLEQRIRALDKGQ